MTIQCPTCLRLNPANASYCYYDGMGLHHAALKGPLGLGARPFSQPFHFSDGQPCNNFNDFVLTCEKRWNEARVYLSNGAWKSFFGALGRGDLAKLAAQAAQEPDLDFGLCCFLEGLPADAEILRPAKLALTSTEEDLGALEPGKDYKVDLTIVNRGMFLLRGSVMTDCDWLSLGDPQGNGSTKHFQTRDTYSLSVRVLGSKLRAAKKPLEGQIAIDTNGGQQTVAVRATVPIRPFPRGQAGNDVLADAVSPREIAGKAKAHPQEAAVLFEQGAVKTWYENNGWTYPVRGTQAKGKSAVQQFFEALGLSKPPRLEINTQLIECQGYVGECLTENVIVHTAESKYVHAEAYSNQDWIKVLPAKQHGKSVTIPLRIEIPPRPGETLEASVTFLGNGQQRFDVSVKLAIASQTAAQEQEKAIRGERRLLSLASVVVLVGLIIAGVVVLGHQRFQPAPSSEQTTLPNLSPGTTSSANPPAGTTAKGAARPDPAPPPTGKHWWDEIQGTNLTALVTELKQAAVQDQKLFERIEGTVQDERRDGYEQLVKKLPELARKPQMRKTLGRFVAECCVYDPSDAIDPLLRDLARPFLRVFNKEDVEFLIFRLGVICDAIEGVPQDSDGQDRKRRMAKVLSDALGVDLDPRNPPKVIRDKAEKALAQTCYAYLPLTAEDASIEHALSIRKVLIEKFRQHLTADFRDKKDDKLLAFLQRKEDLTASGTVQIVQSWYVKDGSSMPPKLVDMLKARLHMLKPEQLIELRPLLSHNMDAAIVLVVLKDVQIRKEGAMVVAAEVVNLIRHPEPKVRESALATLSAMGAAVEKALPDFSERLRPLLKHPDKSIIAAGLQVVQARKEKAADLADDVANLTTNDDAKVRATALNALLKIGTAAAKPRPSTSVLLERLREEKAPDVKLALDNLLKSRLEKLKREQMAVELQPLLGDKDSAFVRLGLKVVQERKADAADVAEEVADVLKRNDEKEVRKEARMALQALGPAGAKALPKLFELLDDKRTPQRTALALVIADIADPKDSAKMKSLVDVLLKGLRPNMLGDQGEANDDKINLALGKIGQPAVDGSLDILEDIAWGNFPGRAEEINYRLKLYQTLTKLGDKCASPSNHERLEKLWRREADLKHKDKKVQEAVGDAMRMMDPQRR